MHLINLCFHNLTSIVEIVTQHLVKYGKCINEAMTRHYSYISSIIKSHGSLPNHTRAELKTVKYDEKWIFRRQCHNLRWNLKFLQNFHNFRQQRSEFVGNGSFFFGTISLFISSYPLINAQISASTKSVHSLQKRHTTSFSPTKPEYETLKWYSLVSLLTIPMSQTTNTRQTLRQIAFFCAIRVIVALIEAEPCACPGSPRPSATGRTQGEKVV